MLHDFIQAHRDEIIDRCKAKVAGRSDPPPAAAEIDHGVPVFLDQLVKVLRVGLMTSPEIGTTALLHGRDLLLEGFSVSEVVHNYGDVCQAITELAVELDATIAADDFRVLNRCLDDAIAGAVTEYGREQGQSIRDGDATAPGARLELRNLSKAALLAFEAIKTGHVGIAGSTGGVLHRSLIEIVTIVDRSLAEPAHGNVAETR